MLLLCSSSVWCVLCVGCLWLRLMSSSVRVMCVGIGMRMMVVCIWM